MYWLSWSQLNHRPATLSCPNPITFLGYQPPWVNRRCTMDNFFSQFIQNYSSVVAPVTALLCGKPRKLSWLEAAPKAYNCLKQCFITAPILQDLGPSIPFVVKIQCLYGIGTVLSQPVLIPLTNYFCHNKKHEMQKNKNYDKIYGYIHQVIKQVPETSPNQN